MSLAVAIWCNVLFIVGESDDRMLKYSLDFAKWLPPSKRCVELLQYSLYSAKWFASRTHEFLKPITYGCLQAKAINNHIYVALLNSQNGQMQIVDYDIFADSWHSSYFIEKCNLTRKSLTLSFLLQ
jgi:hypothetical protein